MVALHFPTTFNLICFLGSCLCLPIGIHLPWQKHKSKVTENISSFQKIIAVFVTLVLVLNWVLVLVDSHGQETTFFSQTTLKLLRSFWPLYVGQCAFLYVFFLLKWNDFLEILQSTLNFKLTQPNFVSTQNQFLCSVRKCSTSCNGWKGVLFTTVMMLLTTVETFTYDLRLNHSGYQVFFMGHQRDFPVSSSYISSLLHKMYLVDFKQISYYIPYNPLLMAVLYLIIKIATLAICYGNVVAVLICEAHAVEISSTPVCRDSENWEHFHYEYLRLKTLTFQCSQFLSPLIATSLIVNIMTVIISVYQWLDPNEHNAKSSVYQYASFVYFTVRIFVLIYSASQVNISSARISQVVSEQPHVSCSWKMYRFEQMINNTAHPPGIYLFGNFIITRKMFTATASVICTTQIVLLQMDLSRF